MMKAHWFNPRDGKAEYIGTLMAPREMKFTSPSKGQTDDWILVLDDTTKGFQVPGTMM